jgi:UDP-N-acetylmuramyl tripeptide synthase
MREAIDAGASHAVMEVTRKDKVLALLVGHCLQLVVTFRPVE